MAQLYDIEIEQGETFSIGLRLKDSANNNALESAISSKAQIRESSTSASPLAEFDCSFSTDKTTLWIKLDADVTQALKTGGKYDVKVIWPDREDFLIYGKVKLLTRVTK